MTERRHARLGRYLLWQVRDYLIQQGPATAIVVALYAYLTLAPVIHGSRGGSYDLATLPPSFLVQFFRDLLGSFVLLGALFATNGIVSSDRKTGYFRFLFSKPVSAPRYYASAFLANGLGMLLVALVLLGVYSVVVRPTLPPAFVPVVLAMYLAYGGIGFLLSTIWRFDWLSLVTVAIVAAIGWDTWGQDPGIRGWLMHLLPPTHRAVEVYAFVAGAGGSFPWATLTWLTGYGLVCFLLGLWVLRVRALAAA
jgi:hypothetical protein